MGSGAPTNERRTSPSGGAPSVADGLPGYRARVAREPMSAEEVSSLHGRLSNWGRWGAVDQLGTLNFITPAVTAAAAAAVRLGRTVSCSRPLPPNPDLTTSTQLSTT
jgi:hypothetical protein